MSSHIIYVLNGPNLNLLGSREPEIYGRNTLGDIEGLCRAHGQALEMGIDFRQTNHEGVLLDQMHEAHRAGAVGIVINPGAYAHTSVALRDAAASITPPVLEVHLTNVFAREPFRRHSFLSETARGVISGLGPIGYALALEALAADR